MRKGIILAIGGLLTIAGLAFLAGCDKGNKASNIPVEPKWKGAAYRIAFDAPPSKPNPAGITIPGVKYTANPDALESRARLVVRFDSSQLTKNTENGPIMNQMVGAPVDIHGEEGALPADYMDATNTDLSKFFRSLLRQGKDQDIAGACQVVAQQPPFRL